MNWDMIGSLIDPQLTFVLAACWIFGFTLKRAPHVPDWCIVYAVTLLAVLLTVWLLGWSPQSLIQGILVGAFAVYGNQLVKQAKKGVDNP